MLRLARRRCACAWLAWQLTATLGTPLAAWMVLGQVEQAECLCGHGPGAFCPMHRHGDSSHPGCIVRSDRTDIAPTSFSLLASVGIDSTSTGADMMPTAIPRPYRSQVIDRTLEIDPPPPRA